MSHILIKNATIVNENTSTVSDLLIKNDRIEKIATNISADGAQVIDAEGLHLMPGMIDDQVHFREPGLTHKGSIATESAAAVAGGITSFMEMPNVNPLTINKEAIEQKFDIAANSAVANHSFYLGATNDNIEDIKRLDKSRICGVKCFMGASTGNMLVDRPESLELIFQHSPILIATHCEDTPIIKANEEAFKAKYGEDLPMSYHPDIRSADACYASSSYAVGLAKKYGSKLHVLHLTTEKEMSLFTQKPLLESLKSENVTAEVCVHHLFFNRGDYDKLGSQIKCNPAVKDISDQQALIQAVNDDVIDIIATDHAPHTWEEKQNPYFKAPAGIPLVQHALLSVLELMHDKHFSLETIVRKTAHAVAERYQVLDRGYIREGYFADLVLVDLAKGHQCNDDNILYKCGWSPFNGYNFRSTVKSTFVNGQLAFDGQKVQPVKGKALVFDRD